MIGTANEMLLYFSYHNDEFSVITTSRPYIVRLRDKLKSDKVGEEKMSEWLTKLGCRQIRPRITMPAIIYDRSGRMFDEKSFVTCRMNEKDVRDITRKIGSCRIMNGYISQRALKILVKQKRAYIAMPRQTFPSIWMYGYFNAPNVDTMVGKLIENNPNHQ